MVTPLIKISVKIITELCNLILFLGVPNYALKKMLFS